MNVTTCRGLKFLNLRSSVCMTTHSTLHLIDSHDSTKLIPYANNETNDNFGLSGLQPSKSKK
jgi:hypothetical protein